MAENLKNKIYLFFSKPALVCKTSCRVSTYVSMLMGRAIKLAICLAVLFGGVGMFGVGQAAELSSMEKQELLSQGSEFFQKATAAGSNDQEISKESYRKALLRFERLVKEGGVHNGKLFYNIGNIYFQLNDIGRAILNYRRAELYIPNDPNLKKNLAFAQSMRQDMVESRQQEKILKTLFFFHYDLSARVRTVIFVTFYVCFWFFAGLKIFSRRPFTNWGLGITMLIAILFGFSLLSDRYFSGHHLQGVLLDKEVIARQGDSHSYQPSFKDPLHIGTEFQLLEDRGSWWQIELADGRTCWIPAQSAELVKNF